MINKIISFLMVVLVGENIKKEFALAHKKEVKGKCQQQVLQ